ncbi:neuronal pentraxin-1-like [Saccoglossus kowalevskii]
MAVNMTKSDVTMLPLANYIKEPCSNSPCQNNGVCTEHGDIYRCDCEIGYGGHDCETDYLTQALVFNGKSSIKYPLPLPELNNEFTLCLWLKSNSASTDTPGEVIFSYSRTDGAPSNTESAGLILHVHNVYYIKFLGLPAGYPNLDYIPTDGKWHHVCLTWNSELNGRFILYVDGDEHILGNSGKLRVLGGGEVYLGYLPEGALHQAFPASSMFVGELTMVNMWDKTLTKSEIENMKCNREEGNLVAWSSFFGNGVESSNIQKKMTNVCDAD